MKRLFKILIMLILVLSFFSFNSSNTEAATTKIAHVNIKSGTLTIRSGAGTKYKKVGSLKKDAGVYVYSQTKSGWSEIRYKNKKAYVATKYLKFANSYLMDKKKIYTYIDMKTGEKSKHTYTGVYAPGSKKWDIWRSEDGSYIVDEDKNGLYSGWMESEYVVDIKYPVKVGQSWDNGFGEPNYTRITSISKTVKTPAGTFKNCIEVTDQFGYKSYYAKNVGHVKLVYKGKTLSQLVSLKNR